MNLHLFKTIPEYVRFNDASVRRYEVFAALDLFLLASQAKRSRIALVQKNKAHTETRALPCFNRDDIVKPFNVIVSVGCKVHYMHMEQKNSAERRFRALLEKSRDVVALLNRQMDVIYISPSVEEVLGYSNDEFRELNRIEQIHPDDQSHAQEQVTALYDRPGESLVLLHRWMHKDGSYLWLETTLFNHFEDPDVEAMLLNFRDVTRQRQIEEESQRSNERLARIVEMMAEGVGIVDLEGHLTYANQAAEQILGLSKNAILQRSYDDPQWQNLTLDGEPLPREKHPIFQTLQTSLPVYDGQIAFERPDTQKRIYLSINAAPLFDHQGVVVGGIGTFSDITERIQVEKQKDDFLSIASHELKTPITTLKMTTQLLRKKSERDGLIADVQAFSRMENQVNKLNKLVDDLLNTSKIQANRLDYAEERVDVEQLLLSVVETIRPVCTTHRISVRGSLDAPVIGDADRLEQVFTNLINNAIKYSPAADTLELDLATFPDTVTITVRDHGVGIPAAHLDKIFDRFYRVYTEKHKQFPGLGMGLYISSEIIKRHGGKITVESTEGDGSLFTVSLPVASGQS